MKTLLQFWEWPKELIFIFTGAIIFFLIILIVAMNDLHERDLWKLACHQHGGRAFFIHDIPYCLRKDVFIDIHDE